MGKDVELRIFWLSMCSMFTSYRSLSLRIPEVVSLINMRDKSWEGLLPVGWCLLLKSNFFRRKHYYIVYLTYCCFAHLHIVFSPRLFILVIFVFEYCSHGRCAIGDFLSAAFVVRVHLLKKLSYGRLLPFCDYPEI